MALSPQVAETGGATQAERLLRADGLLRLMVVINLSSFVEEASSDDFRHLRGSAGYAAALRSLRPAVPFGLDEAEARAEQEAYALRIFRTRLISNHFFPAYRLAWDEGMRARLASVDHLDQAQMIRWSPSIRLTRNGLALITFDLQVEGETLLGCAELLTGLRAGSARIATDQRTPSVAVLEAFLESIGHQLVITSAERGAATIRFLKTPRALNSLRLDRYGIYLLRRISHNGQTLAPDELKLSYAPSIAALVGGTLIEVDGRRQLPTYSQVRARECLEADTSVWEEELCLFAGENALIYTPLVTRGVSYVGGPIGLSAHAYESYWVGIARGIAQIVAYRAEVQQAERRTTDLLSVIPAMTRRVNEGDLSAAELDQINHLAMSLSDIFDSLPELRSMAVSATMFRSDDARSTFEALLRELDVEASLELVNTNVEQLNFFLSYYSDMRLQWQGQRTNDTSMVISEVVMFLALSSFVADTIQVIDALQNGRTVWEVIALGATALAALALVLSLGWLKRLRRLRGNHRGGKR